MSGRSKDSQFSGSSRVTCRVVVLSWAARNRASISNRRYSRKTAEHGGSRCRIELFMKQRGGRCWIYERRSPAVSRREFEYTYIQFDRVLRFSIRHCYHIGPCYCQNLRTIGNLLVQCICRAK